MNISFATNLFEVLVYLIPGMILVFGLYLWKKEEINAFLEKNKLSTSFLIGLYFTISIVAGTTNNYFSKVITHIQYYCSSFNINKAASEYKAFNLVTARVIIQLADSSLFSDPDHKNAQVYRYCLAYDRESSKGNIIERIDRLSALSSFCSNLILPFLLIFTVLITGKLHKKTLVELAFWLTIIIVLELTLYLLSMSFMKVAIFDTFTLFLVLTN